MLRIVVCLAAFLAVLLVGCSSSETVSEELKSDAPKTSMPPTVDNKSASIQEQSAKSVVTIGMEAADVKTIRGAPDDSKHEHGPGGSEVDIWIYKDTTVTFTNGKVSKVE